MTTRAPAIGADTPRLQAFVGGSWSASDSDAWITDANPSDATDIVALVPEGTADDAGRGAAAAAAAFGRWSSLTGVARADHLHRTMSALRTCIEQCRKDPAPLSALELIWFPVLMVTLAFVGGVVVPDRPA